MDGYENFLLLRKRLEAMSDKNALLNLEGVRMSALNEFRELTSHGRSIILDGETITDVRRHSMSVEQKDRAVFSLGWECLKKATTVTRGSCLEQEIILRRLGILPHCALLHVLAMIENVTDGDGAPQLIPIKYNFYLMDDINNTFRGLTGKISLFYPEVPIGKVEQYNDAIMVEHI